MSKNKIYRELAAALPSLPAVHNRRFQLNRRKTVALGSEIIENPSRFNLEICDVPAPEDPRIRIFHFVDKSSGSPRPGDPIVPDQEYLINTHTEAVEINHFRQIKETEAAYGKYGVRRYVEVIFEFYKRPIPADIENLLKKIKC